MNHNGYQSDMLAQLRYVVEAFGKTFEAITFEYLEKCIPIDEAKKFEHVLLTGCGDSYCSGLAAKPVFEEAPQNAEEDRYPGIETEALRNIEASRYYNTLSGWENVDTKGYVLCCVSISGAPVRPREAMIRMNELGGKTIALTDNLNSPMAQIASYAIKLNVPKFKFAPLVIPYNASNWALMLLGLYVRYAKGYITRHQAEEQRDEAIRYVKLFSGDLLNEIEEKALAVSEDWLKRGVDMMDFVAEGQEYATAFFGSAKVIETFGGLTSYDDAEDWCHINFFNAHPQKTGTFVFANQSSPSFSRDLETIRTMAAIKRPLVIITDCAPSNFPEQATVFSLPRPKYPWINALMQHMPVDYIAAFTGILMGREPDRQDSEEHNSDASMARFRNSKLVIIK